MTPHDIGIFQCLAGLITLCLILLTLFAFFAMRGMQESGRSLLELALRLEKGLDPILADLRSGAAQFRTACERTRRGAEQLGELGDGIERLISFAKAGPGGIWAGLGRLAGVFFAGHKDRNGD